MEKDARIYVAGHRGLVGGAILRRLKREGYENLITRTHAELDLTRQDAVEAFFATERAVRCDVLRLSGYGTRVPRDGASGPLSKRQMSLGVWEDLRDGAKSRTAAKQVLRRRGPDVPSRRPTANRLFLRVTTEGGQRERGRQFFAEKPAKRFLCYHQGFLECETV